MDILVDVLKEKYDNPKIILFGVSWGGALGSAYLSTGNLQDKIDGFFCMNSGHNLLEGLPKSVDFVEEYAQNKINEGVNLSYWTEVKDWCAAEPDMTDTDNYFKFYDYLVEANAYYHNPDQELEGPDMGMSSIMNSQLSLSLIYGGRYLRPNFNVLEFNLSEDMERIKVPTLVLWGRHDGVNTIEMGYDAYNSIGGPDFTDKEMVILENSAHFPHVEEQDEFIATFKGFLSRF